MKRNRSAMMRSLAFLLGIALPHPVFADGNENWWDGFRAPPPGKGMNAPVSALTVHAGKLIAGGGFTQAGNAFCTRYVAQFDGSNWQQLQCGTDDWVYALLSTGDDLYVAGSFTQAGGLPRANIARWNGQWHSLGDGIPGAKGVYALGTYQGNLIAAGHFQETDGSPGNFIAEWNGSTWAPLASGLSGGAVRAVKEFAGDLYVGGSFTHAGGQPTANLARWNGLEWDDVGTVTGSSSGWVRPVQALSTEYDGNLIVGGDFTHIDGIYMNGLAEWDGSSWIPLGLGLPVAGVQSISVYQGDLVVFGFLDGPGGSSRIARWNGSEWSGFGSGCSNHWLFGDDGPMIAYDGSVYVGGDIEFAGGHESEFIARWTDDVETAAPAVESDGSFSLAMPSPNPFESMSAIGYTIASPSAVELGVYNSAGQLVATLVNRHHAPGRYDAQWDGRDQWGTRVASGVYFVRLSSGDDERLRKVVLRR